MAKVHKLVYWRSNCALGTEGAGGRRRIGSARALS